MAELGTIAISSPGGGLALRRTTALNMTAATYAHGTPPPALAEVESAIVFNVLLRNARADQITAFAGTLAKLRLYTASYAVLLVELVCNATFAPAADGGVLTLNALAAGVAVAAGNASVARLYKTDGTTLVWEGMNVSGSGGLGDLRLGQAGLYIASGQTVTLATATLTEGNG